MHNYRNITAMPLNTLRMQFIVQCTHTTSQRKLSKKGKKYLSGYKYDLPPVKQETSLG